ncbi:MAG: helix-turn-helix domain-containing protein [Deltaproteobacteria bacterium]|nr:helix-turn-helix domain-containing protein [Deltaproteobacteria bacterium]
MPEALLTTEQVARYLKVDKFTIYRLVAQKKIPAFRVGNQWRFKRKILEQWLQKNMNISPTSMRQ